MALQPFSIPFAKDITIDNLLSVIENTIIFLFYYCGDSISL